ncbi:MAG: hypothetical protein QXK12_05355 [Candidatus Nezhaarchaeales archaeon]
MLTITMRLPPRRDLEYLNQEVAVVFLREIPRLEVAGLKLGPFTEGAEARYPRWLALILEAEGIARITDEEGVNAQDLAKLLWREEHTPKMVKVDDHFYSRISKYLRELNEKSKLKVEAIRERDQAVGRAMDLVKVRVQKIVGAALLENVPSSFVEALTPEEKLLLEGLKVVIENWKRSTIRIEG